MSLFTGLLSIFWPASEPECEHLLLERVGDRHAVCRACDRVWFLYRTPEDQARLPPDPANRIASAHHRNAAEEK